MTLRRILSASLPLLLMAGLVMALADRASAQKPGGIGRGGTGGRPTQPPPVNQANNTSGTDYASIVSYAPVENEKEPEVAGILKVKLFARGGKVLSLRIPKRKITIFTGVSGFPGNHRSLLRLQRRTSLDCRIAPPRSNGSRRYFLEAL